jgi:hypothetical protein
MKNKVWSVAKIMRVSFVIGGIAWLAYGFFKLFDTIPMEILAILSELVALVCSLQTLIRKKEEKDEMAQYHILKAGRDAFIITILLIVAIQIILLVFKMFGKDIVLDYIYVCPFILGIAELKLGLSFAHYEKVGD